MEPLWEKNLMEGEVALLSFLWNGNNASTKEKALYMELSKTCNLIGYYRTLTPSVMLSNFSLPVVFQSCGTKYNNIEWNSFSS
jgi:hypothetical protein